MELVDIYNNKHELTGLKKERKDLENGEYRLSCFVWIINDNNELLKKPEELARLLKPYLQTTLLINEMINLEWSLNGGHIKVFEKGGSRKDRYSSCSYANYLADIIEKEEMKKRKSNNKDFMAFW